MDKLFDETFAKEDNSIVSRNIWYGYIELYTDGQYGKDITLDENVVEKICGIVKGDMSEKADPAPTEYNWYFYGKSQAVDAIGDSIRPTIMIRNKAGEFLVRCNISDHDFALQIDTVVSFEKNMQLRLANK